MALIVQTFEMEEPIVIEEDDDQAPEKEETKRIFDGTCTLSIRFDTPEEYLRWKYYAGGREWDFMVSYPAVMRSEQEFHSALDVDMISKKIVSLLQMGFNVYSANWRLREKEEKIANETTP